MNKHINVDYSKAVPFINENDFKGIKNEISKAHDELHNKTGKGNEFLGWLELPNNYDKAEFELVKKSPLSPTSIYRYQMVGTFIILLLVLLTTTSDILFLAGK